MGLGQAGQIDCAAPGLRPDYTVLPDCDFINSGKRDGYPAESAVPYQQVVATPDNESRNPQFIKGLHKFAEVRQITGNGIDIGRSPHLQGGMPGERFSFQQFTAENRADYFYRAAHNVVSPVTVSGNLRQPARYCRHPASARYRPVWICSPDTRAAFAGRQHS